MQRLDNIKLEAKRKLGEFARLILKKKKLVPKNFEGEVDFVNRNAAYGYFKIFALLVKELKKRRPYLSLEEVNSFIGVSRKGLVIKISRGANGTKLLDRYKRVLTREMVVLGLDKILTFSTDEDFIFSGYTPTGSVSRLHIKFPEEGSRSNVSAEERQNPYKMLLILDNLIQIMMSLSKYATVTRELSDETIQQIAQRQSTVRRGRGNSVPDDNMESSALPLYSTNRMIVRNEHRTYGVSNYTV